MHGYQGHHWYQCYCVYSTVIPIPTAMHTASVLAMNIATVLLHGIAHQHVRGLYVLSTTPISMLLHGIASTLEVYSMYPYEVLHAWRC